MNKRYDIAYVVSHGFAARMIMQTDLLGKLKAKGLSVAVITPDKGDCNLLAYTGKNEIDIFEYKPDSELWTGEYMRLRKYLFEDIRNNPALWEKHLRDLNAAKQRGSKKQLLKIKGYYGIHKILKPVPLLRKLFSGIEKKSLRDVKAVQLLNEIQPRLLIATYPVNLIESRLLYAGNTNPKIKTVIHLLSWDNITCKGFFPQLAERYISWGDIMKEEFREYYNIPDSHIYNTGVPHFDLHIESKGSLAYKEIIRQKGLNPDMPYLFFAMSSPYFAPHEIDIVEWLSKKINEKHFGEMQLVIRPHPQNVIGNMADTSWIGRLKNLESTCVAVDWPRMVESNLSWSMQMNDMFDFALLVEGCSVSINSGSTVSIDSLLHEKPVILTLFDAGNTMPWWKSVRRVKEYTHCKKLIDMGAVEVSSSFEELDLQINRFLQNPKYHKEGRDIAVVRETGVPDGNATKRVVDVLVTLNK